MLKICTLIFDALILPTTRWVPRSPFAAYPILDVLRSQHRGFETVVNQILDLEDDL